ncbi:DUF4829 domain-containing protein [Clostridium botulinum]|uniref:DUF4829 domain-containing protein n=1 Tax=Clostridium botulinum TaxID=1491 RepID=UPI003DA346EB
MNKKILIVIILIFTFLFMSCSEDDHVDDYSYRMSLKPKQVVENYFKYYSEKNEQKLFSTLTAHHENTEWAFRGLKCIKPNSIEEDKDPIQKEGYMKYGRGSINGVKEENVIIYKVDYEVKYRLNWIYPEESGRYIKWFTLIRRDKNSPWLIDEIGEG